MIEDVERVVSLGKAKSMVSRVLGDLVLATNVLKTTDLPDYDDPVVALMYDELSKARGALSCAVDLLSVVQTKEVRDGIRERADQVTE